MEHESLSSTSGIVDLDKTITAEDDPLSDEASITGPVDDESAQKQETDSEHFDRWQNTTKSCLMDKAAFHKTPLSEIFNNIESHNKVIRNKQKVEPTSGFFRMFQTRKATITLTDAFKMLYTSNQIQSYLRSIEKDERNPDALKKRIKHMQKSLELSFYHIAIKAKLEPIMEHYIDSLKELMLEYREELGFHVKISAKLTKYRRSVENALTSGMASTDKTTIAGRQKFKQGENAKEHLKLLDDTASKLTESKQAYDFKSLIKNHGSKLWKLITLKIKTDSASEVIQSIKAENALGKYLFLGIQESQKEEWDKLNKSVSSSVEKNTTEFKRYFNPEKLPKFAAHHQQLLVKIQESIVLKSVTNPEELNIYTLLYLHLKLLKSNGQSPCNNNTLPAFMTDVCRQEMTTAAAFLKIIEKHAANKEMIKPLLTSLEENKEILKNSAGKVIRSADKSKYYEDISNLLSSIQSDPNSDATETLSVLNDFINWRSSWDYKLLETHCNLLESTIETVRESGNDNHTFNLLNRIIQNSLQEVQRSAANSIELLYSGLMALTAKTEQSKNLIKLSFMVLRSAFKNHFSEYQNDAILEFISLTDIGTGNGESASEISSNAQREIGKYSTEPHKLFTHPSSTNIGAL